MGPGRGGMAERGSPSQLGAKGGKRATKSIGTAKEKGGGGGGWAKRVTQAVSKEGQVTLTHLIREGTTGMGNT